MEQDQRLQRAFWGGALVMLFTLIIAGWMLDFVFHITPLQGGVLSQLIAPIVIHRRRVCIPHWRRHAGRASRV